MYFIKIFSQKQKIVKKNVNRWIDLAHQKS